MTYKDVRRKLQILVAEWLAVVLRYPFCDNDYHLKKPLRILDICEQYRIADCPFDNKALKILYDAFYEMRLDFVSQRAFELSDDGLNTVCELRNMALSAT